MSHARGRGKKQSNNTSQQHRKKHGALIFRIIPRQNNPPTDAYVEILLQKHFNGMGNPDSFGFISFLESAGKASPTADTTEFFLHKNFTIQCGTDVQWAEMPEAPPLIPTGSIELQGVHYWIFLLPRANNLWKPIPTKQFPYLKYDNEILFVDNQEYYTQYGYVWVNFMKFVKECGNQLVLRYKDSITCKFGTKCKNMQLCNFLHIDSQNLPQANLNTNVIFERHIVQLILNSSNAIGEKVVKYRDSEHLELLNNTASGKVCKLFEDSLFKITVQIEYQNSKFKIEFTNKSTVSLFFSVRPPFCMNTNSIHIQIDKFEYDKFILLERGNSCNVSGGIIISDFFSISDLPVFDIYYKTCDVAHRIRFRIPILLYRYCTPISDFNPSDSGDTIRPKVLQFYNALKESENFSINMGSYNSNTNSKESWIRSLSSAFIPICTPFTENGVEYYCVVAAISGQGAVILMQHVVDENTNTCVLHVNARFSNINLWQSFKETIYGLSSNFPGFESSLFDVPPIAECY